MAFRSKLKIVDNLSVSSPCPDKSFEKNAMALDTGWYCNQCSKEVYDLKRMSRKEIAKLIENKEGNFCAVISRRQDGSLITKEPTTLTHSVLSTGIILASTALLNSPAVAQSERGDVGPPAQVEMNHSRGEVSVSQTTSDAPSSESSSEQSSSSPQVEVTPSPNIHRTVGAVYIPERGKVRIDSQD